MYVPPLFAVDDDEAWRIVNDAGAGFLVIQSESGLASVYVPVIVSDDRRTIRTHVAKANPWWKSVEDGADVLALFLAASTYVTPSYYPSRLENPGVVPTWNYVAAEVSGRATIRNDQEWKMAQTSEVTSHFESGRDPEWRADDLDPHYREGWEKIAHSRVGSASIGVLLSAAPTIPDASATLAPRGHTQRVGEDLEHWALTAIPESRGRRERAT